MKKTKLLVALVGISLAILATCVVSLALTQKDVVPLKQVQQVANSPIEYINTSASAPTGELVYIADASPPGPPRRITYDLIKQITGPDVLGTQRGTNYRITADYAQALFGCHSAPNGKYIFFKQGLPYGRNEVYRLFILNTQTGKLQNGPNVDLHFPIATWSPDSKFIAYIRGGDADGEQGPDTSPISLCTYNITTGKSTVIIQNQAAQKYSWEYPHQLLYTVKVKLPGDSFVAYSTRRPNIFETKVLDGVSTKIIQDGDDPSASPDNKWIVFLGWPDANQEVIAMKAAKAKGIRYVSQYGLYLYNRRQNKRLLIHTLGLKDVPDVFVWASDSQRLFSIQNKYKDTSPDFVNTADLKDYPGLGEGHITVMDVPSLVRREVAVIKATDTLARPDPENQFRLLSSSSDGKRLYIYVNEIGRTDPKTLIMDGNLSLRCVNLADGTVLDLWKAKSILGADWHELTSKN